MEIITLTSSDEDERVQEECPNKTPGTSTSKSTVNSSSEVRKCEKSDSSNSKYTQEVKSGSTLTSNTYYQAPSPPLNGRRSLPTVKPQLIVKNKVPIINMEEDVFKKFIDACTKVRNTEHTKKILHNLRKRYDTLHPNDKNCEDFRALVNKVICEILNPNQNKFYEYILEVQHEIKRRVKMTRLAEQSQLNHENNEVSKEAEEEEELSKENVRKLKKLDKAIEECRKRIANLEEQEVDFDEDENSAYIKVDLYKRRLIELYNCRSNIINDSKMQREIKREKLIRLQDIPGKMTGFKIVDNAIISFVNSSLKKVRKLKHIKIRSAIPDFIKPPDYPDIVQCITQCNASNKLEFSKSKIEQLAVDAFQSIVQYLQKQRIQISRDCLFKAYEDLGEDPANKDPELLIKLKKSENEGEEKLNKTYRLFESKQEGLTPEELEKECSQQRDSDESDNESSGNDDNIERIESNEENKEVTVSEVDKKSVSDNSASRESCNNDANTAKPPETIDNSNEALKNENESMKEKISEGPVMSEKSSNLIEIIDIIEYKAVDELEKITSGVEKEVEEKRPNLKRPMITDSNNLHQTEKYLSTQSGCTIFNEVEKKAEISNVVDDPISTNIPRKIIKTTVPSNYLDSKEQVEKADACLQIKNKIVHCESERKTVKDAASNDSTIPNSLKDKPESSLLKVRSFAKPPESWKDSLSPEKDPKSVAKLSRQKASSPEFIDLTESPEPTTSRFINPVAIKKRRIAENFVVVKHVVNNYNYLPVKDRCRKPTQITQKKIKILNPQNIVPNSMVSRVSSSHQRINVSSMNTSRKPYSAAPLDNRFKNLNPQHFSK